MYNEIAENKRKTDLIIALFVLFIFGLGYVFGEFLGNTYFGIILAVFISLIMTYISYFSGDKIALKISGAVPIEKKDNPYVYRMVENLCITAGLPLPKIYIIPDKAMNAFATGRDPQHASIALTTGIIENLENEELEGVIAHELSHIKNYDIRLMTIVIVLIGIVALLSDWMLRAFIFRDRKSNNSNVIFLIIGLILAILSPLIAQLLRFAISRQREYLADASAALLTRYPEGLARALEKIAQQKIPVKHATNATAHLYIANPFNGAKKLFAKSFSTHPPIEDRVNRLRKMILK